MAEIPLEYGFVNAPRLFRCPATTVIRHYWLGLVMGAMVVVRGRHIGARAGLLE